MTFSFCTLWLLLSLWQYCDGALLVPGKGCGNENPIYFKKKLTAKDDPTKIGCTAVEDLKSFTKYYASKVPGKIFFLISNFKSKGDMYSCSLFSQQSGYFKGIKTVFAAAL